MQIGIWSTCWFTVALALNNLNSFVFRVPQTRWHTLAVVAVGWVIAIVIGEKIWTDWILPFSKRRRKRSCSYAGVWSNWSLLRHHALLSDGYICP